MSFGANLQTLRKRNSGMTQEALAERMGVSRQTISKWEADEAYPEMDKLLKLSDVFSCSLDAMLKHDLRAESDIYSPVTIETVQRFRMARYVIISPNPEDDVIAHMLKWAECSGLLQYDKDAKRIGWDFPFISPEQQNRFGLRGYAAAYILPEGFETNAPGAEIASQDDAEYAVITITDPFQNAFARIPKAYKRVLDYLSASGFKQRTDGKTLSCFEHVYRKDGVEYMKVYVLTDGVAKSNLHTPMLG